MANIHFLRKMAQDDIWDTLVFAAGEIPVKTKTKDFVELKTKPFDVRIYSNRRIVINGNKLTAIKDVKQFIQYHII